MKALYLVISAALLAASATAASAQVGGGTPGRQRPALERLDPYKNFRAQVMIEGMAPTMWTVQQLPGAPIRLVLTRDWTGDRSFWNWNQAGQSQRKNISITIFGENRRYNLFECWPTKWTGPSLNAKNSGHATERIELVCERMELR
jgi:hypothetical protein